MLIPQADLENTVKQIRTLQDPQQIGDALTKMMRSFWAAIHALPFRSQDVLSSVQETNALVDVANKIIVDLSREGIYIAVIQTLPVSQDTNVLSVLPRAYETTSMIIGFFEGLQEVGRAQKST